MKPVVQSPYIERKNKKIKLILDTFPSAGYGLGAFSKPCFRNPLDIKSLLLFYIIQIQCSHADSGYNSPYVPHLMPLFMFKTRIFEHCIISTGSWLYLDTNLFHLLYTVHGSWQTINVTLRMGNIPPFKGLLSSTSPYYWASSTVGYSSDVEQQWSSSVLPQTNKDDRVSVEGVRRSLGRLADTMLLPCNSTLCVRISRSRIVRHQHHRAAVFRAVRAKTGERATYREAAGALPGDSWCIDVTARWRRRLRGNRDLSPVRASCGHNTPVSAAFY